MVGKAKEETKLCPMPLVERCRSFFNGFKALWVSKNTVGRWLYGELHDKGPHKVQEKL
jgi:hypothetical protein